MANIQNSANSAPKGEMSFMMAMMEAVAKDQQSLSKQQIVDAKSTELAVAKEEAIYTEQNSALDNAQQQIANAAKNQKKDPGGVATAQAAYNAASMYYRGQTSMQDGSVQSDQQQVQSDASNLQMKAQMVQGINSIMSTLSGLLGRA